MCEEESLLWAPKRNRHPLPRLQPFKFFHTTMRASLRGLMPSSFGWLHSYHRQSYHNAHVASSGCIPSAP